MHISDKHLFEKDVCFMDLHQKIKLAVTIHETLLIHHCDVWPDFTPVPFILYDDQHQVAVGEDWPEHYTNVGPGIWVAEGRDQMLMGNTALLYHERMIAIWDTRTWADEPDATRASALLAHEMFHAFQETTLKLPYSNEMLLPQYPHSAQSTALVMEENKWLQKIHKTQDPMCLHEMIRIIASLRQLRKTEIGATYMEYDQLLEGFEGTAAYVEIRMQALLQKKTPMECAAVYLPHLIGQDDLLMNYRHRCYASGLLLCLAADALCPDWQVQWPLTKRPLFDWMREKLSLSEIEMTLDNETLQRATALVSADKKEKEQQITAFMEQPLIMLEGDIGLLGFDPMNLVCVGDRCLHLHGLMRMGKETVMLERPFVEEFEGTILGVKRIWFAGSVIDFGGEQFTVEGLGTFLGSMHQDPEGYRCIIKTE